MNSTVLLLVVDSYRMMLECWHRDPHRRPSFAVLVRRLDALLTNVASLVSNTLHLAYAFEAEFGRLERMCMLLHTFQLINFRKK